MLIVKYQVNVKQTHWPQQQRIFNRNMSKFMNQQATIDDQCQVHVDDAAYQDICEHNAQLDMQRKKIDINIISPLMTISWLYMLPAWRSLLDFNFHRSNDWTDDSQVVRFNDCEYVQKHHIYDWHSFALLHNNTLIHEGIIIKYGDNTFMYVHNVQYHLPQKLYNACNRQVFIDAGKNQNDWKPVTSVTCQKLIKHDKYYQLESNITKLKIDAYSKLTVVDHNSIKIPIYDANGIKFDIQNKTQHRDVQNDNPFLFVTLGFDKYHHTKFTGKHDWDTHGVYWWIANMNPAVQYTKQLTMIMGQIPNCVKLNTIGRITWDHWNPLMEHGIRLWDGNKFAKVYGMIANQITDMEDRDHFLRRRGNNANSCSDGMIWPGFESGCKWPDNVTNLMQLGIILPGPYMLKIWKHVNHNLIGKPGFWDTFPETYATSISMTKSNFDIYNELGIDSTLKSTIEINHTTVLGCTKDALAIEWKRMHMNNNLNEVHTRTLMRLYLQEYFDGVNGCVSMLANYKTKLNVFNTMHHSWQKLVECIISLPTVTDWFGSLGCVVALTRVTGALYNVKDKNNLDKLQSIIKPILESG